MNEISEFSYRDQVAKLLQSISHPSVTRVLLKCQPGQPIQSDGKRYTLRPCYDDFKPTEIEIIETEDEVDIKTTATLALIYACWSNDIELVSWILAGMHELIDTDAELDGWGIIDWAVYTASWAKARASKCNAFDICRLLIIYFGPKLDASGSDIIRDCTKAGHADIVAYLVMTYTSNLEVGSMANDIFKCLIRGGEFETAELFLRLHKDSIIDPLKSIIAPAIHNASVMLFKCVLIPLHPVLTVSEFNLIFGIVCISDVPDSIAKLELILDISTNPSTKTRLNPDLICLCLASCWNQSRKEQDTSREMAQMIVRKLIDQSSHQWLRIGMVVCCQPLNLELLEVLIDKNVEMIRKKPSCLEHVLLRCCSERDIETFVLILKKIGPRMYEHALDLWCEAGDLEAVRVLFEVGAGDRDLLDCIPRVLKITCMRGDTDLAELLIRLYADPISEPDYRWAFIGAGFFDHQDTMSMLEMFCPCLKLVSNHDPVVKEVYALIGLYFCAYSSIISGLTIGSKTEKPNLYPKHFVTYPRMPKVYYKLDTETA